MSEDIKPCGKYRGHDAEYIRRLEEFNRTLQERCDGLREDLFTLLRLLLVEDCAFVQGGAARLDDAAWPILDRLGGYKELETEEDEQ